MAETKTNLETEDRSEQSVEQTEELKETLQENSTEEQNEELEKIIINEPELEKAELVEEHTIENVEKRVLTSDELKTEIVDALNVKKYDNLELEYAKKRRLLHLMGLDNKQIDHPNMEEFEGVEALEDKTLFKETSIQFIDELLNGNRIDIQLLEDIVKIQHGTNDKSLELSDHMRQVIVEELEKYENLNPTYNLKKLKANTRLNAYLDGEEELPRIEEQQEWIEELRNNSKYDDVQISDDLMMQFQKQKPIEDPISSGVKEKADITVEKKISPHHVYTADWEEKYREKLGEYGYWPVKYHSKTSAEFRKRSNNKFMDKMLTGLNWAARTPYELFEMESVCKIDPLTGDLSVKGLDNNVLGSPKLFTNLRIGNGIKFEKMPTEATDPVAFELATLKIRASGIEYPHVFAAKPTNEKEKAERFEFIESQIKSLVEVGEYPIENISVPIYFEPVLERLKRKYAEQSQQATIMSKEDILQFKEEIINGIASDQKVDMFLADYFDESILPNPEVDPENSQRLNDLILKIQSGKKLNENDVELLNAQIELRQSVKVEPTNMEFKTNSNDESSEIVDEFENKEENNIEEILEADEVELVQNPKKIEKFRDYEAERTNPETGNCKTLNAILKLNNRLKEGKEIEQLTENEIDLIERKALLIETFQKNKDLEPDQKSIIKKVFENGNVKMNYKSLHPQEQGLLTELMEKHNLNEMDNTLNKHLGIKTEPRANLNEEPTVQNQQDNTGQFPNEEVTQEEMESSIGGFNPEDMEISGSVPEHMFDQHPEGLTQEEIPVPPPIDMHEGQQVDMKDAEINYPNTNNGEQKLNDTKQKNRVKRKP